MEFDLLARTWQKLGHEVKMITAFSDINDIPVPTPYEIITTEQIASARLLSIQYGVYKILKKFSGQFDFFHVDGHIFLYGAGLYRLLGGTTPIVGFFNRELTAWPLNVSELFGAKPDSPLIALKKKIRWCIEKYIGTPIAGGIDVKTFTNPVLQAEYAAFGLKRKEDDFITGDPFDYRTVLTDAKITEDHYVKNHSKQSGPVKLFYSSRMVPGKGFDLLITAFSRVKNKQDFHLVLGGSGPEEAAVKKMIKDLGLEPYVTLPGWVTKEQVYEFYKQADIFIQARWRFDMTSISLLEGMSFGLPCILPGGGGLEWDAQKSALYFKDGDADDLARKIEELGASQELRLELSRQCYVRLKDDQMNHVVQAERIVAAMKKHI